MLVSSTEVFSHLAAPLQVVYQNLMFWNILERPLSFQKIPQYSFDIKKFFLGDSTSLVLPDFSGLFRQRTI